MVYGVASKPDTLLSMRSGHDETPNEIPRLIRRLMPTAGDAELRDATDNFKQYLGVGQRIYERTKREWIDRDSPDQPLCDRVASEPDAV